MESNGAAVVPTVDSAVVEVPVLPPTEPSAGNLYEDFVPDNIPERLKDNLLVNYFRCRFRDRDDLLTLEDFRDGKWRIERELKRIKDLRKSFEETNRNKPDMEVFLYRQAKWRIHAFEQREQNLASVEERVQKMKRLDPAERHRRVELEKRILTAIKNWKKPPNPELPEKLQEPAAEADGSKKLKHRHLSKLLKKLHMNEEIPQNSNQGRPTKTRQNHKDTSREFKLPDDSYGISIHQMTLSKSDERCPTSYMSYKSDRYPLKDVLDMHRDSPLKKEKCKPDTIRYFHFPANNMYWIEEAIARYYGEPTPGEFNYRKDDRYCEQSSNLLCRQFWTSLQHGGLDDPVHARHMRSHCSLITPETGCASQQISGSKNFVIFMPYLHWETHERRKKMAEIMKEETNKHYHYRSHVTESLRGELVKSTEELMVKHARQLTRFSVLEESEEKKAAETPKKRIGRSALGSYLLQIAKVYDGMDIEPDVRILRDHLYKDPPLHARRTLDQSYYWKLHNTDMRDVDQVVYRETKRGKSIFRTSRVLMVDQLWLYILDDNTIISSFPRRWGRNKPDWSGVHKGIRSHLDHVREGEIQSVYDLALLIMNQCSTVFFDRTKPVDERPELLDIFSNALSHVSGMKCVSFETFWRQLNKLSSDHQQSDFEATARKYLNINPEGELLRETHDIIEELRMMKHIFSEQLAITEKFSTKLQELYNKESVKESGEEGMLRLMGDIKRLLQSTVGSSGSPVGLEPSYSTSGIAASRAPAGFANESLAPNGVHETTNGVVHGEIIAPVSESVVPNDFNETAPNGIPDGEEHISPTPNTKKTIPENTLHLAKDLCRDISLRKQELLKLEESTIYVSEQLKDLLDLKQQQASIIEAKYALERADESVTQGRSIMLFTIVTIIFLPLSFMSSVFGMNASDFELKGGGESMTLRRMFTFLFPISLLIILLSISLAFSNWIRSGIYALSSIFWAAVFEYTWIRRVWLWAIDKCGIKKKGGKGDGFYRKGAEVKRWIYDRREREEMRRAWEIVKERERENNGDGVAGDSGKSGKRRRWKGRGEKRGTEVRDIGSSNGSIVEEETFCDKV